MKTVTVSRPRQPSRRLRRDAEANRQQILATAGRLMAERGLAVPLEDIAAEAGVGIGTLYRRFPSRDDLIAALFQDRMAVFVADLEAAMSMTDSWEAFVWFLKTAAARQIEDRALSELVEQDPGQAVISSLRERIWPLAETLVQKAVASGRLRPDFTVTDLALVQQMLVAIGTATRGVSDNGWERSLTVVLDGLVVSRRRPSPMPGPVLDKEQIEAIRLPTSRIRA